MKAAKRMTSVCLSAVVVGDKVRLLDRNGKRIAVIDASLACETSEETSAEIILRANWAQSFAGMMGSYTNKLAYVSQTGWDRKIGTWLKSICCRRNRNRPITKKKAIRYSAEARPNWDKAIDCLFMQYNNRLHEHRLRTANPWRLWAQTVSGNHRKKREQHEDSSVSEEADVQHFSQGSGASAEGSAIQMRMQWH
jgi:hypothetical protein